MLLTQIAEMNIKMELLIDFPWLTISPGRSLSAVRKTEYLKALGKQRLEVFIAPNLGEDHSEAAVSDGTSSLVGQAAFVAQLSPRVLGSSCAPVSPDTGQSYPLLRISG